MLLLETRVALPWSKPRKKRPGGKDARPSHSLLLLSSKNEHGFEKHHRLVESTLHIIYRSNE